MSTVNLHGIKAEPLRIPGTLGEGSYDIVNILLGHDMAANFSGDIHP